MRIARTVVGLLFRRPLVGTSIIPLRANGTIALIKRRDDGCWALPGGLVDWGEEIEKAAIRELKEETGLTVTRIERLVGVYSKPERDPRMHSVCIVVAAQVEGEVAIEDVLEVETVQDFAIADIPFDQLAHDHRHQLQDYLDGKVTLA